MVPGRKCRVRVERATDNEVEVSFEGLADFDLVDVYVDPFLKQMLEILLCSGRSVLLRGPQGTGKTTLSRAISAALGMEYVFFNCAVCFEASDFSASLELSVDDKGAARTWWKPTDVLLAVRRALEAPQTRILVFLDELNRCRSQALNGIMSAIDSSRRLFDPDRNVWLEIPDNVQWVGAINEGKQFTGTHRLDVAQLDRFAVLELDYPPEPEEIRLLQARYPLRRKRIADVVKTANAIRSDEAIFTSLSMRATDEACMVLSYPTMRKADAERIVQVLQTCFCNRLQGRVADVGSEAEVAARIVERQILLHKDAR